MYIITVFREFGETTMVILAAGGMAGVLSWVFTYPQEPFSNIQLHIALNYKNILHQGFD